MLEKSSWRPRISDGHGRLHERLASAFADDIIEQVICPGSRLPAHRELAYQLKIGVGTVTKAYALLEHQGLVRSDKGRAMFAIGTLPSSRQIIDLSINVPPKVVSDRLLSSTLSEVAQKIDASTFSAYPPLEGEYVHRAALAGWLSETRLRVTGDDLILCNGVQHALSIAFGALRKPGETILTESLPYAGAIAISRAAGFRLEGLPMDHEGMMPAGLEAWLIKHRRQSKSPVLYVTPTSQNPTGSSMSRQRREAIVKISRAFDVMIVEDDIYAVLGETNVPTIRELAPERTIYVSGLSKTLTPGLRIGALVCPPSLKKPILKAIAAIGSPVSALACLIMDRWIINGTASHLSYRVRQEAARRTTLAAEILNISSPIPPVSFHIFIPLPLEIATNLAARALELGVRVTKPSKALNSDSNIEAGVRLCLGSPTFEQLRQSIHIIKKLLVEDFPHVAPDVCPLKASAHEMTAWNNANEIMSGT
jgi:DNA-binding transcriptional MocR family regulator